MADETGGALSPGGRFDRMEQSLMRIEEKLDNKVDHVDLDVVRRRVELLESGESPLGKMLLQDYSQMKQSINDIMLHGSQQAQDASKRVSAIEAEVARLVILNKADAAVNETNRERWSKSYRLWMIGVSLLSAAAVFTSAIGVITGH